MVCSCGIGRRYDLAPKWLWLWPWLVDLAPSLRTSICHQCGPKNQRKEGRKEGRKEEMKKEMKKRKKKAQGREYLSWLSSSEPDGYP